MKPETAIALSIIRPQRNPPHSTLNQDEKKPDGKWPKGTWFQQRLLAVRLEEAQNG